MQARIFNIASVATNLVNMHTYILPSAVRSIHNKQVDMIYAAADVPKDNSTQSFILKTLYKTFKKLNLGWRLAGNLQNYYFNYYQNLDCLEVTLLPTLQLLTKSGILERVSSIWINLVQPILCDVCENLTIELIIFDEDTFKIVLSMLQGKHLPVNQKGMILLLAFLLVNHEKLAGDNFFRLVGYKKLGFSEQLQARLKLGFEHVIQSLNLKPLGYFNANVFFNHADLTLAYEISQNIKKP